MTTLLREGERERGTPASARLMGVKALCIGLRFFTPAMPAGGLSWEGGFIFSNSFERTLGFCCK